MADPQPLFVAVGVKGQRLTSPDGTTWTAGTAGLEGEVFRAVAFGNGRIVAAGTYGGGQNCFAVSKDRGATWQTVNKAGRETKSVHGMAFGGGKFIAVGGRPEVVGQCSPFSIVSEDGLEWGDYFEMNERLPILRRIAYGKAPDGKFLYVGIGDRGRRATSSDGKAWTENEKARPLDTLMDIAYGEPRGRGCFVGCGLHGLRTTSRDGANWSKPLVGEEGEHLNSIVWTGEAFVAVGTGATYVSPDGENWDRKPNSDAPLRVAYGNKTFVGANWRGRLLRSDDGLAWTQTHRCEENIEAVGFGMI
jgi:hypothetical protein